MKTILAILPIIFLTACASQTGVYQPVPSNPTAENSVVSEKQTILNMLNSEVMHRQNTQVTLKASYLKIKNNWAYIETTGGGDPSINAVLHKVNNHWTLPNSAVPCTPACPVGMASCADGEMVCKYSLHEQFPAAPVAIFPSANAHRMTFNK